MPRGTSAFRKSDVERAVLGARAAGMDIARVEIDPSTGRIVIVAKEALSLTDLDAELEAFEARHENKT